MIKGLSDRRRLPRAGKVRLGIKVQAANGKWYPRAVDYFVCPSEVEKALGVEHPKELSILFPVDDPALIFPQTYKMYRTAGLWCQGDGEVARRWTEAGDLKEIECPCEHLESGECGPVATLNFLLPDVPGIGVWQIDTGNKASITELNTALEQFQATFGGLRGVPFVLKLEPKQTQRWDEQKKAMVKTTIHTLRLDSPYTLRQILEWRSKLGKVVEALMPASEHDVVEVRASPAAPDEPNGTVFPETANASSPPAEVAGRNEGDGPIPHDLSTTSGVNPILLGPRSDTRSEAPADLIDISVCIGEAQKCGVSHDLYDRYLLSVYGTRTGDVSDATVAKEIAAFRALKTEGERLAHKGELIRQLNEALKRKAKIRSEP